MDKETKKLTLGDIDLGMIQDSISKLQFGLPQIFEHIMPNIDQLVKVFNTPLGNIFPGLNEISQKTEEILKIFGAYMEETYASYERVADKIKIFPHDGWYLSYDLLDQLKRKYHLETLLNEFHKKSTKGKFKKIIEELYDKRQNIIFNKLSIKFKHRRKIFKLIRDLHNEKRYLASIPLTLSQIDGISKELFKDGKGKKVGFYKNNQKKDFQMLAKVIATDKHAELNLLTRQLLDEKNNYILLKYENRELHEFNRHSIMHGESFQYGTKENSLKAILLLDFVRDLGEPFMEKRGDKTLI